MSLSRYIHHAEAVQINAVLTLRGCVFYLIIGSTLFGARSFFYRPLRVHVKYWFDCRDMK